MTIDCHAGQVLRINAPELFSLPAFRALLDRRTHPAEQRRMATFHRYGDAPNAWSDIFIPFEAYPASSDAMDEEVWIAEGSDVFGEPGFEEVSEQILSAIRSQGMTHGIVWLSNLGCEG